MRALVRAFAAARAFGAGIWLGLLSRRRLHEIDALYYDGAFGGSAGGIDYASRDHNTRGLFAWERAAIDRSFAGRRRLLLLGAGGGREVIALRRLGFHVDAFDCNPRLAAAGSRIIANEASGAPIAIVERDACPTGDVDYDGLIVGWGAYMLIAGRDRRIALLRAMRSRAHPGSPLLISFFEREPITRSERLTAAIANTIRALSLRPRIDLGDTLAPNFLHYFTRAQIQAELDEAGFDLHRYSTAGYGHAVGVSRPPQQNVAPTAGG